MRRLSIFLVLIAILGLVWLAIPLFEGRDRQGEKGLLGALEVVERAIEADLPGADDVDVFHLLSMEGPTEDNLWTVSGVALVQYDLGAVVQEPYSAVI